MLKRFLLLWLIISTLGYGSVWAFDGHIDETNQHLAAAEAAFEQATASQNLIMPRRTLSTLAGRDATGMPTLSSQPPTLESPQQDSERLLNDLPLMQVALAQVAAACAGVQLSVRKKKPDPTIGFRIGKEDSETLTGLSFSVPMFVRSSFSVEVDVANASLIGFEREAASTRRR